MRSPLLSERMAVPHRRHGSPARPYTQTCLPRLVSPVVVRLMRERLSHNMSRARCTIRNGSFTDPTGRVGR
jgi:hypothetical protein